MKTIHLLLSFAVATVAGASSARAQSTLSQNKPTWWDKYQLLSKSGSDPAPGATGSATADGNVDVSDECGPQSETYITLNPVRPRILAAGANEIFRLPMRARRPSSRSAVSSSPMGIARDSRMGPVSRPSSMSIVVTPVSRSPFTIAHWTGAAPRRRGKSEPWTLTVPRGATSMTVRGRICP